jgi:gamma-glutamyltranspeptidase/glutathione hydrolase
MAPTIIAKDGQLFMVTGTPGGRTIINTVLTTILNVIDYGMNAQEAVDAGRMHHQWLPDRLSVERFGFSADTIKMLQGMGHNVVEGGGQGAAQVIVFNQKENMLEGGVDRRPPDGGAAGK